MKTLLGIFLVLGLIATACLVAITVNTAQIAAVATSEN